MNGLAKGGIITLLVGNGFSVFITMLIFIMGISVVSVSGETGVAGILVGILVLSIVVPSLSIIFAVLALVKSSDGFRITAGVLGLVSIVFVWAAYIFPVVINLVGSILTLCGKKA